MALCDDLRERAIGAVLDGGMSRNAAAERFGVSIASAVRWVARFEAKREISHSTRTILRICASSKPTSRH
jgi:transposase